ncbi:hypothetical protein ACHHYP_04070 [Achlya hypogyna]|uniref:Uncharacterized protein n=1 Tax=Achlya hypogyna TaxID=1202772 RepID=A0A1V9Z2A3_ACHHY|nr:hypothetical protein ACHHYP_04070 [Achlya hypogyna]
METALGIVLCIIALVLVALGGICARHRRRRADEKAHVQLAASPVSSSPLFCGHTRKSLLELGMPAPSLSLSIGLRRENGSQNATALSSPGSTTETTSASEARPMTTPTDALRTFNDDFFVLSQRGMPLLESSRGESPAPTPNRRVISEVVDEEDTNGSMWHSFLEEGRSLSVFSGGFPDLDGDLNSSFLVPQSYASSIDENGVALQELAAAEEGLGSANTKVHL